MSNYKSRKVQSILNSLTYDRNDLNRLVDRTGMINLKYKLTKNEKFLLTAATKLITRAINILLKIKGTEQ